MAQKHPSRKLRKGNAARNSLSRNAKKVVKADSSSYAKSVLHAVVTKDEELFFLTDPDGMVPVKPGHGLGLYYHDCRFLSGYEMKVAGAPLDSLAHRAEKCYRAVFQLANPDLVLADGTKIAKETIGCHWDRVLDSGTLSLLDHVVFRNYGDRKVLLPVLCQFGGDFEDVFQIRKIGTGALGKRHRPQKQKHGLLFRYDGKDGVHRAIDITVAGAPARIHEDLICFEVELDSGEQRKIQIAIRIGESKNSNKVFGPKRIRKPDELQQSQEGKSLEWIRHLPKIKTSNSIMNDVLERCFRDLGMLRSGVGKDAFFSAGVPWYVTLFGRDSILAALFNLPYIPEMAETTLRLLAKYQGQTTDNWRDETPGKILHEFRRGELANLNRIPQTPYYGSVDATPLFVLLLAKHAQWSGSLSLFEELKPAIDLALNWIGQYGDLQRNGYLSYECQSKKGLRNQGWKDSGDGIMNEDGSVAEPPIALVEVQGYVYAAKIAIADLFERSGDKARAETLREQAADLKTRFNRDFWMRGKDFYALALGHGGCQSQVISSNPGHALWCGIVSSDRGSKVVDRLMGSDMFSGWGIRTLSAKEKRYNPMGYHLGSVWPHDNAILAAGFRAFGKDEEAGQVFESLMHAASFWEHFRFPELFSGFSSQDYEIPVSYPVACHPQAWAASSPLFLLSELLGLQPNAFEGFLRVFRPYLPPSLDSVEITGLRVGKDSVDLRFEKSHAGSVGVEVVASSGNLKVLVETEPVIHRPAA